MEEEHEASTIATGPLSWLWALIVVGIGFLTTMVLTAIGAVIMFLAIIGWMWEPWVA